MCRIERREECFIEEDNLKINQTDQKGVETSNRKRLVFEIPLHHYSGPSSCLSELMVRNILNIVVLSITNGIIKRKEYSLRFPIFYMA